MLEHLQDVLRHTFAFMQIAQTFVGVEQHVEFVSGAIRNVDHQIGIQHVVDERNVFVADALDVVLAVAVLEHRRALERLDGDHARQPVHRAAQLAGAEIVRQNRVIDTRPRADGTWDVINPQGKTERVRPQDIRTTGLLTVEGELDDISGSGQTNELMTNEHFNNK